MRKRILVAYGTRPEAVKVAPLINRLAESRHLEPVAVITGQHQQMLDQVNAVFGITPAHNLEVFESGQSLNTLSAKVLSGIDQLLLDIEPHAVLVQGDTTTVAMSGIAAFNRQIPVVHLEAGLRSGNIREPFPEEGNRRLVGQVAALHLAPTAEARENLLRENFPARDVVVTGNTVIDAILKASQLPRAFSDPRVSEVVASGRRIILLTAHRRENLGAPMRAIADAVAELARRFPAATIIFPAHKNPHVRQAFRPALESLSNVMLIEPLDYVEFVHLQQASYLVLTDSGGVQEEAPSLGKPVLVLRNNTERPEAVTAGTVRLVGTDTDRIVEEASHLMSDTNAYQAMAQVANPYGDGNAAERSVAAMEHLLGVGERLPDFVPAGADESAA
ncbi:UDP-N-acetylglucosamine 2-epimerase (non-hydrolyzing) [Tessaracoccus sp. SD287]|uniref:non-hydrolyzing UDP-N-acetylglucosamine 2-epimerase n=1 Tax=Tessaracoccus sp. SD287 TaxID=2782008 RepID=UPI001A97B94C|nr:UDP-N-acetylglucosamine 2-epimerase (non-hydrolyzing) [Tessaracoccus sp. SD287]MBO1031874.1 UDP-N-acetylglucosamine 2-epimerase (non-hydrolyzing) [Tessaracoccus sp. SD287]